MGITKPPSSRSLKNPGAKGARRERQARDLLYARGCTEVAKSGGSLGRFDLWGLSPTRLYLVQVKANRRPARAEMDALRSLPAPPYAQKELWVWKDRAPEPEMEVIP